MKQLQIPLLALFFLLSFVSGSASAQSLVNGGMVTGSISPAFDTDLFTFHASANENVVLRAVNHTDTSLDPYIVVYDPTGQVVIGDSGSHVSALSFVPTITGIYTLSISDYGPAPWEDGVGEYQIHFVNAPGANEHGALVNGGSVSGFISMGDLDTFIFDVNANESVVLRTANGTDTSLDPHMVVYDPTGQVVIGDSGSHVSALSFVPSMSGTYTLLVTDYGPAPWETGVGEYDVHYVRAPEANEHGALVNGGSVSGFISMGDLDTFSFDVNANESVVLRAVNATDTSLDPYMIVYDPTGQVVIGDSGSHVSALSFVPSMSGTYTLLVTDYGPAPWETGVGEYDVHYVRAPEANEHGALVNGGSVSGFISMGDLDTFSFDVNANETVVLRTVNGTDTSLDPYMVVYDPTGQVVAGDSGSHVSALSFVPSMSGTYTLLVTDFGPAPWETGVGEYDVHYVRAPGSNEHGALTSGNALSGHITMGDLDSFTFTVSSGADIHLEMSAASDAPALDPALLVFDTNGAPLAFDGDANVATVNFVAPSTGTYTVVVYDYGPAPWETGTGDYELLFEGGAGEAYCFGDSAGANCPCDAFGNAGEGCANSGGLGGTKLAASGTASLSEDSFTLHVTGVPGSKPGLILLGSNQVNNGLGNPVGDGLLCTGGQTARSHVQVTTGGSTVFSDFQGNGFSASSLGAGQPTNYQFWYRDASNACSGSGFNFSNAWTVTWTH
ncbi:MAG: hypothetical protein ACI8X5_003780 [Planctomycetota bacterium]|jgi:hypothetical protein